MTGGGGKVGGGEVRGACADGVPARLAMRRFETPVGTVLGIVSDAGVVAVEFEDAGAAAAGRGRDGVGWFSQRERAVVAEHSLLDRLGAELAEYFAGRLNAFGVPVVLRGTSYQERAWEELVKIPLGRTITYGELARRLGDPDGARSAAGACGANRLAIVVPCHRVIAADGTLWGYGGGLARKAMLLEHEAKMTGRYEAGLFDGLAGAAQD